MNDLYFDDIATTGCNKGMFLDFTNAATCTPDVTLINPIFDQFTDKGLHIKNLLNEGSMTVLGGWINPKNTGSETNGIYLENARGVSITGTQLYADVSYANAYGIKLNNSYNITVTGCLFSNQKYGIHSTSSSLNTYTNNKFYNPSAKAGTSHIHFDGAESYNSIIGNVLDGYMTNGISLGASTVSNVGISNVFSADITNPIVNSGTTNAFPTADQLGYLADASSALLSITGTQTFSNKTADNTNSYTIQDDKIVFQNASDPTKQVTFDLGSVGAGTTRNFKFPNSNNGFFLTNDGSATVTNKTIVAANNTVTTAASGNLTSTNLNAALAELQTDIDTRLVATTATAAWTTFTPTFTFTGGTSPSVANNVGAYLQVGKTLHFRIKGDVSFSAAPTKTEITLPNSLSAITGQIQILAGRNASQGYMLQGISQPGSATKVEIRRYENSAPVTSTGDQIAISGIIEVQ
jgi:parallel beta-helix repeat protein